MTRLTNSKLSNVNMISRAAASPSESGSSCTFSSSSTTSPSTGQIMNKRLVNKGKVNLTLPPSPLSLLLPHVQFSVSPSP